MRKFIAELFTNRFGIVLAALNLCFFAARINDFNVPPFGKLFVHMNFPAIDATILALDFIKTFVYKFPSQTEVSIGNVFFAAFIIQRTRTCFRRFTKACR